jgi:hypothetical protein
MVAKMQSPELTEFYRAYAKWLDVGAPEGDPFTRMCGLCSNLADFLVQRRITYAGKFQKELSRQFKQADLRIDYPFGGETVYFREQTHDTMHLNPQRIAWVRERAREGT